MNTAGVRAADALFADGHAENLAGAGQAGIQGHHYSSPDLLEAELQRFGLR